MDMSSVLGEPFDLKAYVSARILEIENLEDRQLLKGVLNRMLLPFCEHVEGEYLNLEDRIFSELRPKSNDYAIVTGIVERSLYDVTDSYMKPMDDADLIDGQADLKTLYESIDQSLPFYLYHVFLNADFLLAQKFSTPALSFNGTIMAGNKQYPARFFVKENTKYKKQIEELYQVFITNNLPWQTVCCPYLHKLFDVYISSVEGWDASEGAIDNVRVDFGAFTEYVKYNCVPLWNITAVEVKTSAYPEPCVDKAFYDHCIFLQKIDPASNYLVTNQDYGISNIRRVKDDLFISCLSEKPVLWRLYKMNRESLQNYEFPPLTNQKKESFIDHFTESGRQAVKTEAEISRILASYQFNREIAFVKFEITEGNESQTEVYDMDYFIKDEIRINEGRWKLVVSFQEKRAGYFLNRDIMSFLVTQLQKYFPEYACVGKLISESAV